MVCSFRTSWRFTQGVSTRNVLQESNDVLSNSHRLLRQDRMPAVRKFHVPGSPSQRSGKCSSDSRRPQHIVQRLHDQKGGAASIPPFSRIASCQDRCQTEPVWPPPGEPWAGIVSRSEEGDPETLDPLLVG